MRTPALAALVATLAGATLLPHGEARGALPDSTTTPAPGWVTGVAVDRDGDPVRGALVNVLRTTEVPETGLVPDRTPRRTWTAADGSFRVRQGAGGYLVQVCQPDPDIRTVCRETTQGVDHVITYVGGSGTTDSWVLQQSLLPTTATTRALGTVVVQPQAGLAGTLAGAREGEEVRLMRLNDTVAFRAWTDARGHYAFRGLVPGRYYVAAGGTGELAWSSDPVDLTADTTAHVDGALERGASIRGTLASPGGPAARTEVLVSRLGAGPFASAYTDGRGRFAVAGLEPGRYAVSGGGPGTPWRSFARRLTIAGPDATLRPTIRARRGGVVSLDLREGGRPAAHTVVELRNHRDVPVLTSMSDGHGTVRVTGLGAGRYRLAAAGDEGYGVRSFRSRGTGERSLGRRDLDHAFLTLRGRTAPRAVVEATTGDFCPPDRTPVVGAFHEIVDADAKGRYRIGRLVPGRWMLGSDGWPRDHAPRCWSDVRISDDLRRDLPLRRGVVATGRLVYADSGRPVITSLSYEYTHPAGLETNPTEEHPTLGRTDGASGLFRIERIHPGAHVTGGLAREAGDGINDESFFVIHPYQDGTPYWLDTATDSRTAPASGAIELGDIPVTTYGS